MNPKDQIVLEDVLIALKRLQTQLDFIRLEYGYIDRQYTDIVNKLDAFLKIKGNE